MVQIKGIDISSWQGMITALGEDISFVAIKASEGISYVNPYLAEQVGMARADGKIVLLYHFSDLGDPVGEADHFIATIHPYLQKGDVTAIDWETGAYSTSVDDWCAAYTNRAKASLNAIPLLYSNAARINSGGWTQTRSTGAGLWIAGYSANEPNTVPWPFAAMWQFTDAGSEQGVAGNVDEDIFYGDDAQLEAYSYQGDPSVVPINAPDPTVSTGVTSWIGTVTVTSGPLNIRTDPSTNKPANHTDSTGTVISVIGYIHGQEVTQDGKTSDLWGESWNHYFFWLADTDFVEPTPPAAPVQITPTVPVPPVATVPPVIDPVPTPPTATKIPVKDTQTYSLVNKLDNFQYEETAFKKVWNVVFGFIKQVIGAK